MRTEITFGIITDGNQPARVQRLVDSIKALNAPAEIIVVGGLPMDDVTHIYFDESACKDCICHKKNLITKNAKTEIIVYLHDYLEFEPDWYENFVAFGLDWDIQLNPIIRPDGVRYRDWLGTDTQLQSYDKPFNDTMYINGAYWVAKKWVSVEFPQNESLRWKEDDEIDFSNRIKTAKLNVVMNTNSKVKTQYNKGAFVPDGKPVDIVYKTYSGDKLWLWDSIRSVKKFVKNYGRIYLISDDELGQIPADISEMDITLIQNPHYSFITHAAKGENITAGYLNQILIKMELFKYLPVEIERVLLLDSDMIINQVWDISQEKNQWFYQSWEKSGNGIVWKTCVDKVFKSDKSKQAMAYPVWFLTRHLMNCFLSFLAQKLGSHHIDEAFWKKLVGLCNSKLSEFELMGNYLLLVNALDYELSELSTTPYPIKQFRSWDGYNVPNKDGVSPKEEIQLILNTLIVSEPPEPLPLPAKEEKKKEKKPKAHPEIETVLVEPEKDTNVYDKIDLNDTETVFLP